MLICLLANLIELHFALSNYQRLAWQPRLLSFVVCSGKCGIFIRSLLYTCNCRLDVYPAGCPLLQCPRKQFPERHFGVLTLCTILPSVCLLMLSRGLTFFIMSHIPNPEVEAVILLLLPHSFCIAVVILCRNFRQ